ncbi:hypothetical protein MSG28_011790 [Choristoneura fumiferana]|uniref:Uncharacterized protein n=1 Tax=Choristoneura fumiferana TaxID=7141 RepID=A0ACC0KMC7_CHOFU|nr:hypothetical protein MSG28_011790 [Choristoneura fumiferana]
MVAPQHSGSVYFNYKGTFSIRWCNGRISDGGVFTNCTLSMALSEGTLNIPPPQPLPVESKMCLMSLLLMMLFH